jgi:hypothetical protein
VTAYTAIQIQYSFRLKSLLAKAVQQAGYLVMRLLQPFFNGADE